MYSVNSRKKDGGRDDLHEVEHSIKWHRIYNGNGRGNDILLDGQMKLEKEQPFWAHRASIHIEFKLMRLICQIPSKERSGRRRMGKLNKERTANMFLHCFCMWTIYAATWNIAECKWILRQDLLKEFYFEFWLLVKPLECCVSKQTFSLWIGRFSRSFPRQVLQKCWSFQRLPKELLGPPALHCTPSRSCGISQLPVKPDSLMTHVVHPLHGVHCLLWSWNPLNTHRPVNHDTFQPRVYNQPTG